MVPVHPDRTEEVRAENGPGFSQAPQVHVPFLQALPGSLSVPGHPKEKEERGFQRTPNRVYRPPATKTTKAFAISRPTTLQPPQHCGRVQTTTPYICTHSLPHLVLTLGPVVPGAPRRPWKGQRGVQKVGLAHTDEMGADGWRQKLELTHRFTWGPRLSWKAWGSILTVTLKEKKNDRKTQGKPRLWATKRSGSYLFSLISSAASWALGSRASRKTLEGNKQMYKPKTRKPSTQPLPQ